ncbi:MAG: hypothetical protein LQ343_005350 [Gyalolechia ehrenbergii]|nr:MAG: hypothetical protein LQ343_005350 [Gyalolechia ehrenbergii]
MSPQRKNLVKEPVSSRVLRSSAKPLDIKETDDKAGTATNLLRDRERYKTSLGVPNEHRMVAPEKARGRKATRNVNRREPTISESDSDDATERKDTESTVSEKNSPDEQTKDPKTKSESKSKRKPRKGYQRKNCIDNANPSKLRDSDNRIDVSRIEETPSSFSIYGKVNNAEGKDLTSTTKPVSPPLDIKMDTITRRDEESSARWVSWETAKPPVFKADQWSTPSKPQRDKRKHEDDSDDEIDKANSYKKPMSWFVWGTPENQ